MGTVSSFSLLASGWNREDNRLHGTDTHPGTMSFIYRTFPLSVTLFQTIVSSFTLVFLHVTRTNFETPGSDLLSAGCWEKSLASSVTTVPMDFVSQDFSSARTDTLSGRVDSNCASKCLPNFGCSLYFRSTQPLIKSNEISDKLIASLW